VEVEPLITFTAWVLLSLVSKMFWQQVFCVRIDLCFSRTLRHNENFKSFNLAWTFHSFFCKQKNTFSQICSVMLL